MKDNEAYGYRLQISPMREESIFVDQELTRPSSFICTQINIKPLANEDGESCSRSPSPQALVTRDQEVTITQENAISSNLKKKPLPLIPPIVESHPKTSSFGNKSTNALPGIANSDNIEPTTPSPKPQNDGAANSTTFSYLNTVPQLPSPKENHENPDSESLKKKPLPQLPSHAEPRSKADSISYQKKNSLSRVAFADHLDTNLNFDLEKDGSKNEKNFTESCDKILASHNSKKSSSLRVRLVEPKDKIPTFPIPSTNAGSDKKSLPRRVTIGEPREKVLFSDDKQRGSIRRVPLKIDPHSQNAKEIPQQLLQDAPQDNLKAPALNLDMQLSQPEPNDKTSIPTTLKEPAVETEMGLATSKKAMLRKVPLPEPKSKPLAHTNSSPTDTEPGVSHKTSMLRRAPLPEPQAKAPQPTAKGSRSNQKSNSLRRGALLPEPEEEAPTYSSLKLLQSGANNTEDGRKGMVESVVYDDPLPVTGGSLSRPRAQSGQLPVYDDPLPVRKPLNVAQMFSKCSEAKMHPEPEPYEIPIMKS